MRKWSAARALAITAGDIRLNLKDKSLVVWIFLMPLAFIFFFGASFRMGSGGSPKATLTIEDRDGGFLAQDLIEALAEENLYLITKLKEGRNPVRTLIIPQGFTESVLAREKTKLVLRKERDSDFRAGEAAGMAVVRAIATVSAGLVELEIREAKEGNPKFRIEGDSLRGSLGELADGDPDILSRYRDGLDSSLASEKILEVDVSMAGKSTRVPSGFQRSVPASLVMFVLMTMLFSGTTIAVERSEGILSRIASSPAVKAEILTGKLLGRMAIAGAQILFLLLAGRFLFRVDFGNAYFALFLLMTAFAFCAGALSLLFGSLFTNPDNVTGFAVVTALVMSALGGCWWPLEVVSRPFRIIAMLLPTGWTMKGLNKIIMFGYGLSSVGLNIIVLAAFGAVFLAAASRKLKLTP